MLPSRITYVDGDEGEGGGGEGGGGGGEGGGGEVGGGGEGGEGGGPGKQMDLWLQLPSEPPLAHGPPLTRACVLKYTPL